MKKLSIAAALVVLLDQITKIIFTNKQYSVFGFEIIKYTENAGAAFSILQGYRWIFIAVAIAALIALFFYARKIREKQGLQIIFGVLIGGIAGNLIDRIFLGYVRDFINTGVWSTFNLADSAMFLSVIILAVYIIKNGQKHS